MKTISACVILLLLTPTLMFGKPIAIQVENLKCEYLSDPIAIGNQHPTLSWQLIAADNGKSQKAYKILVAGSPALLAQNKGDYWNSGIVHSSNSIQVSYAGKPLPSGQKVYWKVMVWDENNQPSAWSKTASWGMGLVYSADWKAKWIGAMADPSPDAAVTYPAPYFRKEFSIAKKIKQAKVYVSGLGFYELYLNGKKIGDQVLAPAVTNYDKRPLKKLLYHYDDQSTQRVLYNTFDVTGNINPTKNAIGILLGNGWYNQRDRTVEGTLWYDLPKVIFQLEITYTDGSKNVIASDNTWKTTTGPLLKDGIFTGENYDARLILSGWDRPRYNDSGWKPAMFVKPPTGVLQPQLAPFDKVTRTLQPTFDGKTKDSVYTYHLDETVAGWAAITVKGRAGSRVKIRYISEEGDDYRQYDTYTLKGGETETWEPKFTWHAFRKIEVIAQGIALNAQSIRVKDVHTDVAANGSFECSNPLFNKINTAYLKTQLANLHGSLSSDCPHRERLGYTGDGQVAMESALLSFNLPQFYRKWFNDMDDARNHKTGFVTHTAPFAGGGGGPAWGSAYVIMPELYFNYYGDTSVLRQHYAGMKQWVEYLQTRTDKSGLISHEEPNGWCLGDWCTPTKVEIPEPFVNTAYFYHVTSLMAKVAAVLGKTEDRTTFINLAQQIKKNFNTTYFNPATNTYWQSRQGAEVFALAFGLADGENYNRVFNSLLKHLEKLNYHFDTGILATPLLLNVLAQNDRDDIAYKIMDQKSAPGFGYLLDDKNSTLWESWNGSGSHTHPMFGSVVAWLYSSIGGIKTDDVGPGLKHFIIAPKPVADLTFCKSSYNSLYGKIRSEWKTNAKGNLEVLIAIPQNTSATFVLPPGKTAIKNDAVQNIKVKTLNGKSVVEFGSGEYQFEVM